MPEFLYPSHQVPASARRPSSTARRGGTGLLMALWALSGLGAFWGGRLSGSGDGPGREVRAPAAVPLRSGAVPLADDSTGDGVESPAPAPQAAPRLSAQDMMANFARRNWDKRIDAILSVVLWMAQASEAELAEVISTIGPTENREPLLSIALARWTQFDGLAAFRAFAQLPADARTSGAAENLFNGWILYGDPKEAIECALAYGKSTEDVGLVPDMLMALFDKDRARAVQLTMELCAASDPGDPEALLARINGMVKAVRRDSGVAAALALINQCPRSDWQEGLRRDLAVDLLGSRSSDLHQAGYDLLATMPDPFASTAIVEAVADRKLEDDAPVALAWATALPLGETRSTAVLEIVNGLKHSDRVQEAVDWVTNQGSHADFDAAHEALALYLMEERTDANTAFQLAARITDQNRGGLLQRTLAAKWLEKDFDTAAKALGPAFVDYTARLAAQ